MPYIVLSVIALGSAILLVDKRRLREFYPTFLFVIVAGHVFDRFAVYFFKLYDYTDPLLSNHAATLMIHTVLFPPLAVVYVQYAHRFNFWALTFLGAMAMTFIEWWFVVDGELTYYRWNLLLSFIGYLILELSAYIQYRWYLRQANIT